MLRVLILTAVRRNFRFRASIMLRYDFIDHLPMHICEAKRSALEGKDELFMIKPKPIQNRCLNIIGSHFAADGVITDFICLSKTESFPDTAARHPDGEGIDMMVPSF